ncbi:hypothetical protein NGM10_17160 (plasmid) [Halorussus salilacus]|uniref:hypothetical protein n=1 Tax=Halorussus salilacus TaxID=2953750 RepID=UPI00209E73B9|nr:hypothetical protein [Halorussus salilacus]USZ69825.1 hypothetical protein NGM10_17160 [Halorussus salilacus]
MTDETPRLPRSTRRGFLALAACGAFAGCTDLVGDFRDGNDEEVTVDGAALREVVSADAPTAPATIPVDIERAHLDESESRARDSLSSVPAPLDSGDVPNGAIRAELTDTYEGATGALDAAADAESDLEAAAELRSARRDARAVAASWAAIEEGLTRDDVRGDADPVGDALDDFRRRWRYVGDDPVRAVVVHETIESLVERAAREWRGVTDPESRRGPERETRETPMAVGETAGALERARASLDDAAHFYDRFDASLDDSRRLGSALGTAGESLAATVERRLSDLPDGDRDDPSSFVDRELGDAPAGAALAELYSSVDTPYALEDARSMGQRASVVTGAHETLVRIRAFESLRERIEDGEFVTVESADDVRTLREDAVDAVETALDSSANPLLVEPVVTDAAWVISFVDGRLPDTRTDDEIRVGYIDHDLGGYVRAAELARATPPTSRTVASELRDSASE